MGNRSLLVGSLAPIFIAVAVIGAGILPTIKNLYGIEKNIYDERVLLEQQYQNRVRARQTLRYLKIIKEKLPEFNRIGIQEGQEIEFITALENIADANGLNQRLSIQPPDTNRGGVQKYSALTVVIRLTGDAAALISYLRDVEKLEQYLFIDNISITPPGSTASEGEFPAGTVSAVIQGKVPQLK